MTLRSLAVGIILVPLLLLAYVKKSEARTILIQKFGTVATASPAVEIVGSTATSTNVTSSSISFTTDANTSLLAVCFSFRRNAGQTVRGVTFNGSPMTISTAALAYQMYAGIWYMQSPPATTANIVITLSGNSAGFGAATIAFKNSTTAPANPGFNSTQSVTTSTASATTNLNDILLDYEVKQDSTTAQPTLNTAGVAHQAAFKQSGTATDSSGWDDMSTQTGVAGTTRTNYSWAGASNHSHVWTVIKP